MNGAGLRVQKQKGLELISDELKVHCVIYGLTFLDARLYSSLDQRMNLVIWLSGFIGESM